jgi:4-hydroxy-4-methyl-2-oxoglutarate aldolase
VATVTRNVRCTQLAIVDELAGLGVASVHEAQRRTGLLDCRLRPIYRSAQIAGNAVTCEVAPGDNLTIHVAIEQCDPGDILVVSPTSPCEDGYLGDLLATSLKARRVRGVVIEAGVRNVSALTQMGFRCGPRRFAAQGTVKETLCNVQCPMVCGGTLVNPGDVISVPS